MSNLKSGRLKVKRGSKLCGRGGFHCFPIYICRAGPFCSPSLCNRVSGNSSQTQPRLPCSHLAILLAHTMLTNPQPFLVHWAPGFCPPGRPLSGSLSCVLQDHCLTQGLVNWGGLDFPPVSKYSVVGTASY